MDAITTTVVLRHRYANLSGSLVLEFAPAGEYLEQAKVTFYIAKNAPHFAAFDALKEGEAVTVVFGDEG